MWYLYQLAMQTVEDLLLSKSCATIPCSNNMLNDNDSNTTRIGCANNKSSTVNSSRPAALPRFRFLIQSSTVSTTKCSDVELPIYLPSWLWNLAFNESLRDWLLEIQVDWKIVANLFAMLLCNANTNI